MHADHALLTGLHHLQCASPCQDYTLSGHAAQGTLAWGAISDGCSTGGHTDLGARAWVLGLRDWLQSPESAQVADSCQLADSWLSRAEPYLRTLQADDALATAGAVWADVEKVHVALWGDGVVWLRRREGGMRCVEQQFSMNAPPYPQYWRDARLLSQYRDAYGAQQVVRTTREFDSQGQLLETTCVHEPISLDAPIWRQTWPWDAFEVVALASDGALSRAEVAQTLWELVSFKGLQGEFVKRRVARLYRQWTKDASLVQDDLSIAAVANPLATL